MANLHPFAMMNHKITDSGIPKLSLYHRRLVLEGPAGATDTLITVS